VHDDLVAGLVDTGRVAAEDHRQPFGGQADATQRPQVVVVERRRPDRDRRPVRRRGGFVDLADLQRGQRVFGGKAYGGSGEHASDPNAQRRATPGPVMTTFTMPVQPSPGLYAW
jgi:hypothetical protein